MEDNQSIIEEKLTLASFVMLAGLMGLCLGIISVPLNSAFDFYIQTPANSDINSSKVLGYLLLPITVPLMYMFGALISYPIYSLLHSKGFKIKLKTCNS